MKSRFRDYLNFLGRCISPERTVRMCSSGVNFQAVLKDRVYVFVLGSVFVIYTLKNAAS